MTNPLLQTEGLPAFSAIQPEHVEPALAAVLADNRAIIEAVTGDDSAASWETVVQPIELMEHRLARTWSPVSHLNAVVNNAELRDVYNRSLPRLSEYQTEVGQNEALFRAYQRVAESADLTPVQRKVVEDALRDFRPLRGTGPRRHQCLVPAREVRSGAGRCSGSEPDPRTRRSRAAGAARLGADAGFSDLSRRDGPCRKP
jgi:Zn-dependent oligopeptidase